MFRKRKLSLALIAQLKQLLVSVFDSTARIKQGLQTYKQY